MSYTRRKRRITKKKKKSRNTIKKYKGGNKKYYKCIILIIDHTHILTDSSTAEYKRNNAFKDTTKKYINSDPDIYSLFICGDDTLTNGNYRLDATNNTLYTPCKETYSPGILEKTLLSMKYVVDNYNFDYLLRTNLSTFFVLPKFKQSLETVPKTNLFKGPINTIPSGEKSMSGTHMLFSKDVIQKLVEHMDSILKECNSKYDDVCITEACTKFNIPYIDSASRYDFTDIDTNYDSVDKRIRESNNDNNIYMYRIKCGNETLNMDTAGNDIMILDKLYNYFYNNTVGGGKRKGRKNIKGGNINSKVITWILPTYICVDLAGSENMAHSINKYLIKKGYIINVIIHENTCSDTLYEGVNITNSNDTEKVKLAIDSSSILFSQNYGYPELAIKKANELNKPVVIFLHTHHPTFDRNPEEYRGLIDPSKINIVYNSVWLKNFFNSSLNSIVLNPPINCADYNTATNNMYVSLLNKNKGGDIVLRIAEKMPDVKFLIIGGNENKIVNNITYKPNTKNVKEIYAETDIVLMPSVSESWGMVATEAMCSGIPTIASPTEGLKENLGYAGLFIDRDSIDEWVSMIYKLKNDRTFYNDISNKCKARVQELDPTIQLENFSKFIDNIISK